MRTGAGVATDTGCSATGADDARPSALAAGAEAAGSLESGSADDALAACAGAAFLYPGHGSGTLPDRSVHSGGLESPGFGVDSANATAETSNTTRNFATVAFKPSTTPHHPGVPSQAVRDQKLLTTTSEVTAIEDST